MRTKGDILKISEVARKNSLIEKGQVDAAGNVVEEVKVQECSIEKSLKIRQLASGNGPPTSVVADKTKKAEANFTLKLKGAIPKLMEKKEDPKMKVPEAVAQ